MPAGRPRKPTALKILEGDQPCRIPANEPKAKPGAGPCPPYLDDTGRKAWSRLSSILDGMGILTEADGDALAMYCAHFSIWFEAQKAIREYGITIEGMYGLKANPAIGIACQSEKIMGRILGRFGMTPADRASLRLSDKEPDDDFDKYIKEKQARLSKSKSDGSRNEEAEG